MKKNMGTKRKHLFKAITWNLLAMATTYIVLTVLPPFFDLEGISKKGAGFLVAIDRVLKLIFYYGHERVWFSVK
ncbi:DUF2061 domain-containing protein [Bacteroidota bacterium]|nr:DUF2061 domain-containing protein [Bacteroidota bacterium]